MAKTVYKMFYYFNEVLFGIWQRTLLRIFSKKNLPFIQTLNHKSTDIATNW